MEKRMKNLSAAGELTIWRVEKEIENKKRKILTDKMTMHNAFRKRNKIAEADVKGRYHVEYTLE